MRFELELIVNFFTLNNLSLERKMLLTTMPEDITPSVKRTFINDVKKLDGIGVQKFVLKALVKRTL